MLLLNFVGVALALCVLVNRHQAPSLNGYQDSWKRDPWITWAGLQVRSEQTVFLDFRHQAAFSILPSGAGSSEVHHTSHQIRCRRTWRPVCTCKLRPAVPARSTLDTPTPTARTGREVTATRTYQKQNQFYSSVTKPSEKLVARQPGCCSVELSSSFFNFIYAMSFKYTCENNFMHRLVTTVAHRI